MQYKDNPEFNDALDQDGDVEIAGNSYVRSDILFRLDPRAYEEALLEWRESTLEDARTRVAELHTFPDNRRRLEALIKQVKRGRIIPFIGAGVTIPCGYPGWTTFLVEAGGRAGEDRDRLRERLTMGEYEEVAELVIEKLGPVGFSDFFSGAFGEISTPKGALPYIAKFSGVSVLTTNFDRAVELAFKNSEKPFQDVFLGRHNESIKKRVNDGDRFCFKLHGDVQRRETRVLTLSEYNEAYGSPEIDFTRPLPKNMHHIFTKEPLLFVGCSLNVDRTMELFRAIVQQDSDKGGDFPHHYAILEAPDADRTGRERFLTERNVFPIWYPTGEHNYVVEVCRLLALEMTT